MIKNVVQVSELYVADFINSFLMNILAQLHETIQLPTFRFYPFDDFGETSVMLDKKHVLAL